MGEAVPTNGTAKGEAVPTNGTANGRSRAHNGNGKQVGWGDASSAIGGQVLVKFIVGLAGWERGAPNLRCGIPGPVPFPPYPQQWEFRPIAPRGKP